ncbi:pentapeptide repeat-containing protein [Saccharophagus degradans]|uniref:pentapeptide repeat-containing protein n=1 Tax=Saccharophagus degradans TaxID=86304 RepID=UPI001C091B76|nr:pentapeptide repeat-containing protein [Saccharophagus degradans]MBU2985296.1 pentapeptide repeat-containing protein [Saccharophagus degradans]
MASKKNVRLTIEDFTFAKTNLKRLNKSSSNNDEIEIQDTPLSATINNRVASEKLKITNCPAGKIVITDCEFQKDVIFSDCEFKQAIEFNNCSFTSEIKFTNCDFKGDLNLLGSTSAYTITFKGCTFSNTVRIPDTIKYTQLTISDTTFTSEVNIRSVGTINFNDCEGDIYIRNNKISIQDINPSLVIKNHRNSNIFISIDYNSTDTPLPRFENIYLSNLNELKSLEIAHLEVDILKIGNSAINCSMLLTNINTKHLELNYLTNKAGEEMVLNGISPLGNNSKFQLEHSSLGSAQIRNCKLSKFSEFKFIESEIDRVLSRNTEWPFKVETKAPKNEDQDQDKDKDKDNSTRGLEAYYRACKDIYEKSGERARSLEFKSRHTELQYKFTEWNWPNFPYKLAILISSLSSDHGTNWIKALLWLLLSTSVSTVLIIIASIFLTGTNGIECFCTQFGTFNLSSIFFQLLLPTHKFDALVGVEAHFLTYAIDMLTRVANGYLIFQIIKSSRSYSQ